MLKNAMLASIFMIFLLVSPAAASETISTFDFNNIDSLDGYGSSVGLAFSGWSLQSIGTSGWLQDSVVAVLDPKSTATITFGESTRLLGLSFANLNILSKVSWTAYFFDNTWYSSSIGSGIKKGDIDYLGTGYIKSLVFTSSTRWGFDTLALDNLSIATPAATPLPGAAVFFVSGLLGMLGLKRRQVL